MLNILVVIGSGCPLLHLLVINMEIKKSCRRMDFSSGEFKTYYIITIGDSSDIDYLLERLRSFLRVPPRYAYGGV